MQTCVFATNNPAKAREIKSMLQSEGVEMLALSDLGLVLVPDETGGTFEENARIKARETAALLKARGHEYNVLADDSGLSIDAFGGRPGVDSANFLGAETPYPARCQKILQMLENESNRAARFTCVIACAFPDGRILTARADIEGEIAREMHGSEGFGYDPIFFLPEFGKTAAQLSAEEKNRISHRGLALRKMIELLKKENPS